MTGVKSNPGDQSAVETKCWGAGPYVGQHLPPIMVLLSSSVRQSNAQPLKLQALEGWQALVKALVKEAPHQLADVADQVLRLS